ncbi:hypothetical protein Fmac_001455 [Flemingia macrophylla]|uniref:Uncharacterized protein n=1 Tax=Flemingia macrophylla TaxID=520843 RepID=A0ABD1NH62_9FABA
MLKFASFKLFKYICLVNFSQNFSNGPATSCVFSYGAVLIFKEFRKSRTATTMIQVKETKSNAHARKQ